ncbi:MAG: type II toxin-antitoxin system CcdA family antitoxin [Terasakiella sp.]|uniref:type II toxin-antitoxin system CcdA family antitoxin n=1 Tax=unclassified Terasakiella TaxID=2614952 RepID=UPI003B009582
MPGTQTLKKPTNLSLDQSLLAEAKALKINLSHAAEAGLRQAVARAKSECWEVRGTKLTKFTKFGGP